ncbi:hypothetical protein TNCV_4825521 [Trichonephila clavipes]|uniref:Uncharacterized protein n=1 Tax=Trichonephila clavipes TaxID=2585209 RepID=A0A8X6V5B2_TRICX|nr:hypothetical protein TNCV_4825521 [Trichonephila clavipes]
MAQHPRKHRQKPDSLLARLAAVRFAKELQAILTTSFSNWMADHHKGWATCEITSMNMSLTDRLDQSRTTTCPLPSGHPEVLT